MTEKATGEFKAHDGVGNAYVIEEVCDVTYEDVPASPASYDPMTKTNRPEKAAETKEFRGPPRYRLKGKTTPVTQNNDGTWRFIDSASKIVILKA